MRITKRKFFGFLGVLGIAIGVITAFASLTTLNLGIAIVSLTLIVIFTLIAGFMYFREKDSFSEEDINIENLPIFNVRYVLNEAELKMVADLDEECYGEHTVDFPGLMGWSKRYTKGIHALFHHRRLIGAIGIWPLTKKAFENLTSGKLMESHLSKDDICKTPNKHMYWYFGDIIIEKKYRRKLVSSYLPQPTVQVQDKNLAQYAKETVNFYFLFRALEEWLQDGNFGDQVQTSALGATPGGRNLLVRLGFHKSLRVSLDKLPIYIRVASYQELLEVKEAILRKLVK